MYQTGNFSSHELFYLPLPNEKTCFIFVFQSKTIKNVLKNWTKFEVNLMKPLRENLRSTEPKKYPKKTDFKKVLEWK